MATIEIFEKVDEIVFPELKTADENRAVVQKELERQAEKERKRLDALANDLINHLAKKINKTAEKGYTEVECTIYPLGNTNKDEYNLGFFITQDEFIKTMNKTFSVLESVGYNCSCCNYRLKISWD